MTAHLRTGIALLALAALFRILALAQVPASRSSLAQQGWYADPEIHIFQNQYWIYPTYSGEHAEHPLAAREPEITPYQQGRRSAPGINPQYLQQSFLDAFSSPDLVHWTRHPHILDIRSVSWAAYAVWAPSAIWVPSDGGGKYYLFFGANDIQKNQTQPGGIGVAVSNSPSGPFTDALGKPLIGAFHNGAQPIDPFVFRDDDGRLYLYYGGQGHCNVTGLSPDLKQIVPLPNGQLYQEITPAHYVEGPFLIKRHGVYYFMWSEGSWGDATYGVAYAKSTSPTGPFTRVGKILQTDPAIATGPGHHSVLHIPATDDWYIVYHRHPLGDHDPNHRLLAIDRMYFDANGNILPIRMTLDGVPPRPLEPNTASH